eukprot:CAMPEP_0195086494 /NCGR_PEP_ID=MMETSP0448-20130528/26615_1 /TAXON_ID=66468 /ORGANISM="Heterocapsa triquestra, Strain CCMP 448" /LENGTH=169 /DNA_ID=CAMNT_0040119981 /DNA_START=615 /DNA_END=1122 /DNA_ORIENTATION=-
MVTCHHDDARNGPAASLKRLGLVVRLDATHQLGRKLQRWISARADLLQDVLVRDQPPRVLELRVHLRQPALQLPHISEALLPLQLGFIELLFVVARLLLPAMVLVLVAVASVGVRVEPLEDEEEPFENVLSMFMPSSDQASASCCLVSPPMKLFLMAAMGDGGVRTRGA